MLDGLLGRGFAPKCKSLIKLTKTRIDGISRKRKASEKFLKKDIADLLANGLDINAYGRTDVLLDALRLSSCYDFVEHLCDFVLKHLSIIHKQRECPEDCREVVSSLMFAAARFSDLPELRDLRQIFQERYGNSLELFVDQNFVANLASRPSTLEKKVQLMQDIALEFSIKWDSRAFEKRMSKPSTYLQDQPKTYGSFHVTDDKNISSSGMDAIIRGEKHDASFKERLELTSDGHRLHNGNEATVPKREAPDIRSRHEPSGRGYKALNGREETILKKDGHGMSFQGRQEVSDYKHEAWNGRGDATLKSVRSGSSSQGKRPEYIDDGSRLLIGRENTAPEKDYLGSLPFGKPEIAPSCAGLPSKRNDKLPFAGNNQGGQQDIANAVWKAQEDEINKVKPYYNNALPPPYVKPNVKLKASKSGVNLGSSQAGFDSNLALIGPSMHKRGSAGSSSERIQLGSDHSDHERQVVGPVRVNSNGQERDHLHPGDVTGNPIPKPKSSRRRHSKSRSHHDDTGYSEATEVVTRRSRNRRRDESRRGLQILVDEHHLKDEEERALDKLLIHYSKKSLAYEPGRVRRKSKTRHAHYSSTDGGESPHDGRDGPDEGSEMVLPPPRSVSLPREQTGPSEATKVFARAASFQPDRSNPARHVHPKLPDYDDLAAQFAALRGGRR